MMDLRVSVVLLFIFVTGGYSLKCYKCTPDLTGSCDAKEETCGDGLSKCYSITVGELSTKGCAPSCDAFRGTAAHCCNTDLCNAADGVYKGSFLLLLSPLLFYFLFQ